MTQKEKRTEIRRKFTEKINNCYLELIEENKLPNRMAILIEVKRKLRLVCGIENIRKHLIKSGAWDSTKNYSKEEKEVAA